MSCHAARGALLIRCIEPVLPCDDCDDGADVGPHPDGAYRVRSPSGCRVWSPFQRYPHRMFRTVILAAAESSTVARIVEKAPISRAVVRRFVAGHSALEPLRAAPPAGCPWPPIWRLLPGAGCRSPRPGAALTDAKPA